MSDLTAYTGAFRADPAEPTWLVERRRSALARFRELGLPTRRQENWRFTNLRALETTDYPPEAGEIAAPAANSPRTAEERGHDEATALAPTSKSAGLIVIELGNGRRIRVDRDFDAEALRRVLDVLDRRR